MFKKLLSIQCLLVLCVFSAHADLPICPSFSAAKSLFYNVPTVVQTNGPAGYQLSYYNAGVNSGVTTQYNYYSQTDRSAADALQQIHNLSALLHTAPLVNSYQQNGIAYKQCLYWGAMIGAGIPTGNQVLSIAYSEVLPPQPLHWSADSSLPTEAIYGTTYTVRYHLSNNNAVSRTYTLNRLQQAGVTFIPVDNACNVNNQQSLLEAHSSCNIAFTFDPAGLEKGDYDKPILRLTDQDNTQSYLSIHTLITDVLAHNVIVFGDSLSDIGNAGIYTNKIPGATDLIWPQYLMANEPVSVDAHTILNSVAYEHSVTLDRVSPNQLNLDYAYGGALANNARTLGVPGLLDQIKMYQSDLGGVAPDKNTLYVIWAGGNDLLTLMPKLPNQEALNAAAQGAVDGVEAAIKQLTMNGEVRGNQIVIFKLPNLGVAPIAGIVPAFKARYTVASQYYNSQLASMLVRDFPDSAQRPVMIDIYENMQEIIADHGKAGTPGAPFTNISDICSGTSQPICKGYLFNDPVHPTTEAHAEIAAYVKDHL